MSRVVTQETFNEIVQEIIDELGVSFEEAVEDASQQLKAQGVDLTNIRKSIALDFLPKEDIQLLDTALKSVDESVQENLPKREFINDLKLVCEASEKSNSHKIFLGKNEFVRIALDILEKYADDKKLVALVLKALVQVTTDQPDVLNGYAAYNMAMYLEKEKDVNCLNLLLQWMKVACIKHEENRRNIVDAESILHLKNVLRNYLDVPSIVKGVCSLFRALVLDDDIRVEFGHAPEHARKIADATLPVLVKQLKKYKSDKDIIGELLLTLSAVIVRNEYCEQVLEIRDGECLSYILDVFVNFPDSEKLNRQCLKLLKVLAGSDRVKKELMKSGAASLIVMAMARLQSSSQLVAAGNGCISAMTLRSSSNSKVFCEVDAPFVILDGMRTHKNDLSVQKQGCWAVRNMVARNREICPIFLELGAEDLINYVLETFKEQCEYDAKAALRDLGCHVQFREEWTGEGGALN